MQILDLNDDCIYEIFRIFQTSHLGLLDLCSLAETCKRFRAIARDVAPKELAFWMVFGHDQYSIQPMCHYEQSVPNFVTKRTLSLFGQCLTSVTIDGDASEDDQLIEWVVEHCKLEHLAIRYYHFARKNSIKMQPVFKHLHQLGLELITMSYDAKLFAGMESLSILRVHCVENCGAILRNTFPKLEHLSYEKKFVIREKVVRPFKHQNVITLASFFVRHPRLKTIEMRFSCDALCTKVIFHTICSNCADLEEFAFSCGLVSAADIEYVKQLKSLKILSLERIWFESKDFRGALKEMGQLRF